jgi:putative tryptophan/tyrosine transport system substrate-binding protein
MTFCIGRREFITLIGGAAAAWPLAAQGQQPDLVRRVAILISGAGTDPEMQARVVTIRQRLDSLGWSEGRNLRIDIRFAEADPGRHVSLARALVALRPDAIIAYSTPIASALRRESSTIPIVFVNVSDPIGSGLVASLARPNSNVTGLMLYEEGIAGKWLAMLKEIAPQLTRAALIANPKSTPFDYFVRSAKAAASSLAVEVVPSPIENAADIEQVIASLAQSPMPRPTLARLAWRPPGSAPRTICRVSCSRRWPASTWPMYPIAAAGPRSLTSSVAKWM